VSVRHLRGLRPVRLATVAQALLRALCGQLVTSREARALERRILREPGLDGRGVAGGARRVDAGSRDLRRLLHRAAQGRQVAGGQRAHEASDLLDQWLLGLDQRLERRPALEAGFTRERMLDVGEADTGRGSGPIQRRQSGKGRLHALQGGRVSGAAGAGQLLREIADALVVLESIDAVDLAFDTFVCSLLDGEVDTSGYPEYNAIVGGVAAHWDEATGDMICRAVVGWGGKGVRGDTDRIAAKLLSGILTNILANQYALGLTPIDRPVPAAGRGGLVCAHCGFASAHERAFYCPKCGMRLLRG
jgi:hypothetical protein